MCRSAAIKHFVRSFYSWYHQTLRNPKYRWLLIGVSLLYLICPFDIAPDFIFIISLIDDSIVATLLVAELSELVLGFLGRSRKEPFKTKLEPQVIEVETETAVNNEG